MVNAGSSPLARGLHVVLRGRGIIGRIIPARAGFTTVLRTELSRSTDHPRSRGVYVGQAAVAHLAEGSSPLARGLRWTGWSCCRRCRIIPARAGFTRCRHRRSSRSPDHPRSRGVYETPAIRAFDRTGSSPLARGLLVGDSGPIAPRGIIPARAGFTPCSPVGRTSRRDHPRSRGVYRTPRSTPPPPHGSSPLARGLRPGGELDPGPGRIIPARAGFTSSAGPSSRTWRDHPRSRGVYYSEIGLESADQGSSPLARGLPRSSRPGIPTLWIIPARAGFTLASQAHSIQYRDHPRSRGVYSDISTRSRLARGSSPLARGLRLDDDLKNIAGGIIPARAGFTVQPLCEGNCGPDHPRSRGVYHGASAAAMRSAGSSPLARGLLCPNTVSMVPSGIIPARAGFTITEVVREALSEDHPRSRGVYSPSPSPSRGADGSSPLARGLQHSWRSRSATRRIIPARAGFTPGGQGRDRERTDHPRSRGVYGETFHLGDDGPGSSPLARGLPYYNKMYEAESRIIPARAGFTAPGGHWPPPAEDHPRSRGVYVPFSLPRRIRGGSSPLARGLPHGERMRIVIDGIIPARAGFTIRG